MMRLNNASVFPVSYSSTISLLQPKVLLDWAEKQGLYGSGCVASVTKIMEHNLGRSVRGVEVTY